MKGKNETRRKLRRGIAVAIAGCAVSLASGCATHKPERITVPHKSVFVETNGVVKRALCVGMVNSKIAGACSGADVDSQTAAMLAAQRGFDVVLLQNEEATRAKVRSALKDMIRGAQAGSTLWLFWSGHGGQMEDISGDESDGLDECLYPWDTYLLDDELADEYEAVLPGVRCLAIFDTCNSGSMARRALASPVVVRRSFKASLLVFSACADGKVAYGNSMGGFFWTGLFDAWTDGASYLEWFDGGLKKMRKQPGSSQVPQLTSYGDTSWANGEAL